MIFFREGEHHIGKAFTPSIEDIARRLAHINRYNGDVGTYSVAQHCVLVALMVPPVHRLAALLHDACEAYIGDMTSPVKGHVSGFQELEDFYLDVIDRHYRVVTRHPIIKEADLRMLVTEVKSFGRDVSCYPKAEPYNMLVDTWSPDLAMANFLKTFETYHHVIR